MKGQVRFKVGRADYTIAVEESKEMETLLTMAVLGNPPHYCNLCENKEVFKLDGNKDKEGNIYINVFCKKCQAKAKLGQYKTGGYFWHKFVKWEGSKKEDVPERDVNSDLEGELDGTKDIEPF